MSYLLNCIDSVQWRLIEGFCRPQVATRKSWSSCTDFERSDFWLGGIGALRAWPVCYSWHSDRTVALTSIIISPSVTPSCRLHWAESFTHDYVDNNKAPIMTTLTSSPTRMSSTNCSQVNRSSEAIDFLAASDSESVSRRSLSVTIYVYRSLTITHVYSLPWHRVFFFCIGATLQLTMSTWKRTNNFNTVLYDDDGVTLCYGKTRNSNSKLRNSLSPFCIEFDVNFSGRHRSIFFPASNLPDCCCICMLYNAMHLFLLHSNFEAKFTAFIDCLINAFQSHQLLQRTTSNLNCNQSVAPSLRLCEHRWSLQSTWVEVGMISSQGDWLNKFQQNKYC